MSLLPIQNELRAHKNEPKVQVFQRFFKTDPGQYGHGDLFLGLTVPVTRSIAHRHVNLKLNDIQRLLDSPLHEERLAGLFILKRQFQKKDAETQQKIVDFYLKNTHRVNNWDLVDSSAEYILGPYFFKRDRATLHRLARSKNLWERRIALLATFHFIKQHDFNETLSLCEILMKDSHDLIHKAIGWMLREIGKRDRTTERKFLDHHAEKLPRTALRYALEHFSPEERTHYMSLKRRANSNKPSLNASTSANVL